MRMSTRGRPTGLRGGAMRRPTAWSTPGEYAILITDYDGDVANVIKALESQGVAAKTEAPRAMASGAWDKAGDGIRTHDIHVGKGTLTKPIYRDGRELRSCSTTRWTHGCGKPGHVREKQSFHVQMASLR